MKFIVTICCCVICFFAPEKGFAAAIVLNGRNAVAWLEQQTLTGRLNDFFTEQVTVRCNNHSFEITVRKDSTFSFVITLQKGVNKINVETSSSASRISSDTLILTLGYN